MKNERSWLVKYSMNGKPHSTTYYDSIPRSVLETRRVGGLHPIDDIVELTQPPAGNA
jgi:hypothetical protein